MEPSRPSAFVIGAGPGLGAAIAARFAREGFVTGLMARRQETLDLAAERVRHAGPEPAVVCADAGDPSSLRQGWEVLATRIGQPTVAIFNAMAGGGGPPTTLAPEAMTASLAVNVIGALLTAQLAAPAMRMRRAGTILMTGGGLALRPDARLAALATGKAALRSLTDSLAQELAPDHIHVATVTVCGRIAQATHFDPAAIADWYWTLHRQPPAEWVTEHVFA